MKRREFIKKASLVGLGALALPFLPKMEDTGVTKNGCSLVFEDKTSDGKWVEFNGTFRADRGGSLSIYADNDLDIKKIGFRWT